VHLVADERSPVAALGTVRLSLLLFAARTHST
jgi:hypothetical protein